MVVSSLALALGNFFLAPHDHMYLSRSYHIINSKTAQEPLLLTKKSFGNVDYENLF